MRVQTVQWQSWWILLMMWFSVSLNKFMEALQGGGRG